MRFFKKRLFKKVAPLVFIAVAAISLTTLLFPAVSNAQLPTLDPAAVRAAVVQMGMDSLSKVIVTDPPQLLTYVNTVATVNTSATDPPIPNYPAALTALATSRGITVPKAALLVLGKALFWDQQVGSDGQACATCHFQAGADPRSKNVLNPGSRNTNVAESTIFNPVASAPNSTAPGPNYQMTAADFPFFQLSDPMESNYQNRHITFDTDDIVGSEGTFHATFTGSPAPNYATANALGVYDSFAPIAVDPVFNVGGKNVRSVGPRQAAPAINAMFNFRNFWDGRASDTFNGVNPLGPLDQVSMIWRNTGTSLVQDFGLVTGSSLASQACGPPSSQFSDEMVFAGRTMPDLGRKLLRLTSSATTPGGTNNVTLLRNVNIIPLGAQQVSATDSVLGAFKNPGGTNGGRGLNVTYEQLIQWAFVSAYWDGTGPVDPITLLPTELHTAQGFHPMEANFTLFWGLAIQAYERTLRADQSPYDLFMAGNDSAFDTVGGPTSQKSQDAMRGLLTYIHTESTQQQQNPIFNNISFGACQLCHSGPELTEASAVNVPLKGFVTTDMTVRLDHNRGLVIVPSASNFDVGFTNISVRPFREDLGIGADAFGAPLSFFRQFVKGFAFGMIPADPANPNPTRGTNIDGAFKIPSLRNIDLTGPYYHNGSMLTLMQMAQFYSRMGNFVDVNEGNTDVGQAMVHTSVQDDVFLVDFMLTLTDERVRWEQAPFDHPQLIVPNGQASSGNHPVLGAACLPDNYLTLPAVGAAGRAALPAPNNTPLQAYLGISATPVAGPNNDQFDP